MSHILIPILAGLAESLGNLGIDPVVSVLLAVLLYETRRLSKRLREEIEQVRKRTERLESELLDNNT